MRLRSIHVALLALAIPLASCGGEGAPGPHGPSRSLTLEEVIDVSLATWELTNPGEIDNGDSTVEISVSRLGCASGETGEISDVDIDRRDDSIDIRASVEPLYGSAYDCQGNKAVETEVDLGGRIGERELIDAACEHSRAGTTAFCDTAVRWPADTAN